jgi:hypothetical protein
VTAQMLTNLTRWHHASGAVLTAQPGDWMLTAVDGSHWTIRNDALNSTYERQHDGRYRPIGLVDAVQLRRPVRVRTPEGQLIARQGDWLVRNDLGHVWMLDDARFYECYRREATG